MSIRPNQYDTVAAAFARSNRYALLNEHYERPAMRTYLGDVQGTRVFDAGCGPGHLTEWMIRQGAFVVGVDASVGLLAAARQRMPNAMLVAGDLNWGIPLRNAPSFHTVLGSLFLHYLPNPLGFLRSAHRVLYPSGRIIMSVHHPSAAARRFQIANYFESQVLSDVWEVEGDPFAVQYLHHPLGKIVDLFHRAHFRITALFEPEPDSTFWARDPIQAEELQRSPRHLFVAAMKPDIDTPPI